jgi:hypothetical protein
MTCPPHFVQNFLWLALVSAKVASLSFPFTTLTWSGFHSVNAFTGPALHARQSLQWQYPIANGAPVAFISIAPQKHTPL